MFSLTCTFIFTVGACRVSCERRYIHHLVTQVFPFMSCAKVNIFVSVRGILRISGKWRTELWKLKVWSLATRQALHPAFPDFLWFSLSLPSVISSSSAFSSPGIWPRVRLSSHGWKPDFNLLDTWSFEGLTAITDFSTVQVHQWSHRGGSFTGTPICSSSIFQLEPRLCFYCLFVIRVVGYR